MLFAIETTGNNRQPTTANRQPDTTGGNIISDQPHEPESPGEFLDIGYEGWYHNS